MAPVKIAIVTDSTAYLPKDVRERLGIRMIPLSVIFGDETYREEIDMTADEFLSKSSRILSCRRHRSPQSANLSTCSLPFVRKGTTLSSASTFQAASAAPTKER